MHSFWSQDMGMLIVLNVIHCAAEFDGAERAYISPK